MSFYYYGWRHVAQNLPRPPTSENLSDIILMAAQGYAHAARQEQALARRDPNIPDPNEVFRGYEYHSSRAKELTDTAAIIQGWCGDIMMLEQEPDEIGMERDRQMLLAAGLEGDG